MSLIHWPHPAYAEDQPYAKSILYVHVLQRGFQAGAGFGLARAAYKAVRARTSTTTNTTTATTTSTTTATATAKQIPLARTVGRASLVGAGVTAALLTARMYGLQRIEWQDRSWRLLENEGQVRHDRYCEAGVGVGAVSALLARTGGGWQAAVGRVGVGAFGGAVVCEIVRAVSG